MRWVSDHLWNALALAWVGSASMFASGLSQHALAAEGGPEPSTAALLPLGTVSGLMLGAATLVAIAVARKGG